MRNSMSVPKELQAVFASSFEATTAWTQLKWAKPNKTGRERSKFAPDFAVLHQCHQRNKLTREAQIHAPP